jgi:hypothetical protein
MTIDRSLRAMKKGAALHYQHTSTGPRWSLSNGLRLSAEVARGVIADPNVVAVDLALFRDSTAQTWRYAWTE